MFSRSQLLATGVVSRGILQTNVKARKLRAVNQKNQLNLQPTEFEPNLN
jgi:hypothetical protein